MIDKLIITTKDFKVRDSAPLIIRQGDTDYKTGEIKEYPLFSNESKETISGKKAIYNSEKYILDINMNGLRLSFNPNHVFYGNNYFSVNEKENKQVLDNIEKDLRSKGFLLDFKESEIYRVDVVKQIETEKPFLFYSPLYRMLSGKRMKPQDYGTTYNYSNKTREVEFYDKIQQLKDIKKFKDEHFEHYGINKNNNIVRCELREKKSNTVKRDLNISSISDFYRTGVFEHLTDQYREQVSDLVFKKKLNEKQLSLDFMNDVELLTAFINTFSAGVGIDQYILHRFGSIDNLIAYYRNDETFKEILKEAGCSRTTIWRTMNKIGKGMQLISGYNRNKKDSSIPGLYSELYEKLMAA